VFITTPPKSTTLPGQREAVRNLIGRTISNQVPGFASVTSSPLATRNRISAGLAEQFSIMTVRLTGATERLVTVRQLLENPCWATRRKACQRKPRSPFCEREGVDASNREPAERWSASRVNRKKSPPNIRTYRTTIQSWSQKPDCRQPEAAPALAKRVLRPSPM